MTVLITGGAGFIGSHLAERLLKDGNKVLVIDNLSTGSTENIESFKEHPRKISKVSKSIPALSLLKVTSVRLN